jgi:hypothetical protein
MFLQIAGREGAGDSKLTMRLQEASARKKENPYD